MPSRIQSVQAPNPVPGAARILLVEDDIELRDGLAENLRLNGLSVYEAATGAEFRTVIAVTEIEVAIIDVNLPDASGFELAGELGDDAARPGVVILTARSGRRDRLEGYSCGADLYMTKPVDNEELELAVKNLARRVIRSRAHRTRPVPDERVWQLDIGRRTLTSPEKKTLVLTGKEVMLLELFEKAGDKTVSRAFLGSVMGYGFPGPQHRGLDAVLRRLKEKAGKSGADLPLLNIHAVGLRFAGNLKTVS